jgi:hypothetical protein
MNIYIYKHKYVGDEWLSLPEVFSNLDFAADSSPATYTLIKPLLHPY